MRLAPVPAETAWADLDDFRCKALLSIPVKANWKTIIDGVSELDPLLAAAVDSWKSAALADPRVLAVLVKAINTTDSQAEGKASATAGNLGVGVSFAINVVDNRTEAQFEDSSTLSGAGNVTLTATGTAGGKMAGVTISVTIPNINSSGNAPVSACAAWSRPS